MELWENATIFCAMVIMYNLGHGLADAKSGRMRCLRPRLDSIGGAPDPLRQQAVPEHALGPRWSRWTYARGKKQEEARSANWEPKAKLIPDKLRLSEKICRAQSLQVSQTAWLIAGGNETVTVPGSGSRRSISSTTTEYE